MSKIHKHIFTIDLQVCCELETLNQLTTGLPAWQAIDGEGKGRDECGRIEHALRRDVLCMLVFPLSPSFGHLPHGLTVGLTAQLAEHCTSNAEVVSSLIFSD